jgi:acyl-CoA hydrolase/acyl dehydratase
MRMLSPGEFRVADFIRTTDSVIWGEGTAEPRALTRALAEQRAKVDGVRVVMGVSYSETFQPEHADHICFSALGGYVTNARLARAGVLDVIPAHISSIPSLIRSGTIPVDVVFVQVSPPDSNGRYRLGLAADYLPAAIERARVVVAEVNERVPRTYGETGVDPSSIHIAVEADDPPLELPPTAPGELERTIAGFIAERVADGSVLQFVLGAIPDAVCVALTEKRDLGIHSGLISDGILELAEAGALTNRSKPIDAGISVAGVLFGTRRLYEFADLNPAVELRPIEHTHSTSVIGRFNSFVSIHTALEVDLTGQVNAETLNGTHVGAVGGAVDFVRGAAASPNGTSIIALPSTAASGRVSRIVGKISDAVVSTPRSDVDLVVTEYAVAELRGRSLRQRAENLIAIAHPDFRAQRGGGEAVLMGLWFEELVPGLVVTHALHRTVTEMDNVLFSTLTMNPQPLHLDEEFAKTTEFGTRLVNSLFTLGLIVGMTVPELTLGTTVANLGFESVVFPAPVFHGDTLRAETEVVEARGSNSRQDAGVVTFDHRGFNQKDVLIVRCRRTALMRRRPQE